MYFVPVSILFFLIIENGALGAHVQQDVSTISRLGHHKTADEELGTDNEFTPAPSRRSSEDCHQNAECVLPVQCPAHIHSEDESSLPTCTILNRKGICCTTGQNHTGHVHEKGREHLLVRVDPVTLGAVTRHTRVEMTELHIRERRILSSGRSAVVPPGTASYGHFRNSKLYSPHDLNEVWGISNRALEIAFATKAFKDRHGITNKQLEFGMIRQDLHPTALGSACMEPPRCPPVSPRFRNIDGSCNSLRRPLWGMSFTAYARLLAPSYRDGIWAPRVSEANGEHLKSPRLVSNTLIPDNNAPNHNYNLMLMQYGQFLSHDITQSIDTSFANGSAISCCSADGTHEIPSEIRHFTCLPILIPEHDPFFHHFKQRCMNFVRSVLAPRSDCTLGYAQQMNKVTHFIDGSSIYGSSWDHAQSLRAFRGGRLRVFNDFGRDLLPLNRDEDACLTTEQGSACFASGDTRTNQMVSLAVLHTIFMREHNRLAKELQHLNPHWDDERLYQEARRIVGAELQVITYKEYLPTLLGQAAIEEFGLHLESDSAYSSDYDQRIEPSVLNEFSTAAFRFGHSVVESTLKIYGVQKMEAEIDIPEVMFHPARLRKREFLDQVLNALTTESIQDVDNSLSEALTKYMFRAGNPFGVDLASINIQRGRDHGLRPYNDYRQLVGLPRIKSFEEYGPELGNKLKTVYASVDDIDLWLGGLVEPKYGGSILGLTFRDIIAEQFARLKRGDKYFFEHDPAINPGYFTPSQLQELRKVTLSRVLCDNKDGILMQRVAPNAFRKPDPSRNPYLECNDPRIPKINLLAWKE